MTAVGVASPNAQGQLITKQAIPNNRLNVAGLSPSYQAAGTKPPLQHPYQIKKVTKEMPTTVGTKTEEIESAKL
jgi:hypothetical protein